MLQQITPTEAIRFSSATIRASSNPRLHQQKRPQRYSDQALKLAQFACVKAQETSSAQDSTRYQMVIETVAKAIERAFTDNSFGRLSLVEQENAAARLTEQCLNNFRMIDALNSALQNPGTLAFQLKSNALHPHNQEDVFDHIVSTHRNERASKLAIAC